MQDKPFRYFGLLVAYVLPGFIALAGIAPIVPVIAQWLRPVSQGDLGLAPPLYAVLAATAAGLVIGMFRWVIVDNIIGWTGVDRPDWDDARLADVLGGFDYLVQNHFRYYEFAANTLVAGTGVYVLNRLFKTSPVLGLGTDLGMLVVLSVLFAASRDALAKYYLRTGRLVGRAAATRSSGARMYNGNDHGGADKSQSKPETKPQQVPKAPVEPKPEDVKSIRPPK